MLTLHPLRRQKREVELTMKARPVALPAISILLLALTTVPAAGQLRPLDPVDWGVFEGLRVSAWIGGAYYDGQRASLAGTTGSLMEIGTFSVTWRSGRVALRASGTTLRRFRDDGMFAEPVGGARSANGDPRQDAGDHRLSTVILLTEEGSALDGALRFGVRLPTTDNREGLERDQTDFFATVAGRWQRQPLTLIGEVGIGIFGTRESHHEQVDPLLYAFAAEYDLGALTPVVQLVGQNDPRSGADLRGTEDLRELRLGLRAGDERWIEVAAARGLETFSPRWGFSVRVGFGR